MANGCSPTGTPKSVPAPHFGACTDNPRARQNTQQCEAGKGTSCGCASGSDGGQSGKHGDKDCGCQSSSCSPGPATGVDDAKKKVSELQTSGMPRIATTDVPNSDVKLTN